MRHLLASMLFVLLYICGCKTEEQISSKPLTHPDAGKLDVEVKNARYESNAGLNDLKYVIVNHSDSVIATNVWYWVFQDHLGECARPFKAIGPASADFAANEVSFVMKPSIASLGNLEFNTWGWQQMTFIQTLPHDSTVVTVRWRGKESVKSEKFWLRMSIPFWLASDVLTKDGGELVSESQIVVNAQRRVRLRDDDSVCFHALMSLQGANTYDAESNLEAAARVQKLIKGRAISYTADTGRTGGKYRPSADKPDR